MTALLLAALALPPRPASYVAAWLLGRPDIADDLVRVCQRESRCRAIGVHERDSHLDGYRGQVRLGHLDPQCQRWQPGVWTTWGAFGLSAASNWPYLPRCYQPHWLAVPLVSAIAAARKYLAECEPRRTSRWCPGRRDDA